tara:strand:+ start:444 stop:779 length:336 start_codon:yes stop_codon:yes gene_type:complete
MDQIGSPNLEKRNGLILVPEKKLEIYNVLGDAYQAGLDETGKLAAPNHESCLDTFLEFAGEYMAALSGASFGYLRGNLEEPGLSKAEEILHEVYCSLEEGMRTYFSPRTSC